MSGHSPDQSPGECQEQDLSPQPSPALQPHPRPPPDPQRIPSSGLPERRRTSLCCPNTREIHDFGVVQHPPPCPSHVPCPALTTVPRSGATPKLGVRPVLPTGPHLARSRRVGGREPGEQGLSRTSCLLAPLSAACWDGASSSFSSLSLSSSCAATRDQLVLIKAGLGRECGRPVRGRRPPAPSQLKTIWELGQLPSLSSYQQRGQPWCPHHPGSAAGWGRLMGHKWGRGSRSGEGLCKGGFIHKDGGKTPSLATWLSCHGGTGVLAPQKCLLAMPCQEQWQHAAAFASSPQPGAGSCPRAQPCKPKPCLATSRWDTATEAMQRPRGTGRISSLVPRCYWGLAEWQGVQTGCATPLP